MKDGADCAEIWGERMYAGAFERLYGEEGEEDDMEARVKEDVLRLGDALSWRSRSESRVAMDKCAIYRGMSISMSMPMSMSVIVVVVVVVVVV